MTVTAPAISIDTWSDLDAAGRRRKLARPALATDAGLRAQVQTVLDAVRANGDEAIREFAAKFGDACPDDLQVSAEEIRQAENSLPDDAIAAIDAAIDNVRRFHKAQRVPDIAVETTAGVACQRVTRPVDAVGLYVPAGSAPLPSAAIMLAVPAAIAGCPVVVMCTPPTKDGTADAAVVTAAVRSGVRKIFKVGGAQAVAAMAYGTHSVPKVCKIFGPGNAWVTAAKSAVSSDPQGAAIDMPAGPSEVLVIADDDADPGFVAADLLSQAEHGPDSQVLLVTTSFLLARAVQDEVTQQLAALSRREIAAGALANSRLIVVDDLAEAVSLANDYAPEHLILQCADARRWVDRVRNAGSVFVGPWTPESVGDYCSGTNHVLPTYGYARSYSGLGLDQFLRHMTVQELSRDGLAALGRTVMTLARLEGLDAHARAVSLRLGSDV